MKEIMELFKKLDGGDIMLATVEIFGAVMGIAFLCEIGWCGALLILGFAAAVVIAALLNKWIGEKKYEKKYRERLH